MSPLPSRRARRLRRARILAAIMGFGLLGSSLFGLGVAAQAAPPDPAATPSISGSPPDGPETTDTSPPIEVFVNTDTDLEIQVYADGAPYCLIPSTGVGPSTTTCSGAALPLGTHTFTAVADYAGGPTIPSATSGPFDILVYDDTATSINSYPPIGTDSTMVFEGNGPAGGELTLYDMNDAGNPWCVVAIAMDTTWECTTRPIPPGNYGTVRASGASIGPGGSFTTVAVTVNPPVAPVIQDTFGPGWVSGYDQPELNGNKVGSDLVEVHIQISQDDVTYAPYCDLVGEDPGTNLWFNCTPTSATLQPGLNYFRATVVNEAGVSSPASAPLQITLVDTPIVTSPADGAVTNNQLPQFEVENAFGTTGSIYFQGPGTQCSVPIAGNEYSCVPAGPLADGTYTYFAWVQPGQGVTSEDRTITIDTAPPSIPVITGPAPPTTNNLQPTITGTGDTGTFVNILVDGVPNACTLTGSAPVDAGAWECRLVDPLTIGPHDLRTVGVDEAGNASAQSGITVLTVVAPTATITPTFSPWYTSSDFVQVQGTHSENTLTVQVQRAPNPGGPWTPYCLVDYDVPVEGLTVWFCDESDTPQGTLSPGPNYLRATVMADGGASSPPSTPILITRVDPPTIGSPAGGIVIGDSTPTFSGTAPTQASFVEVVEAGEVSFPCVNVPVQPDGSWSCTADPMADGTYEVYVSTNIGPGNGPYTFTINTTAPPFPVIDTPASPAVTPDPTPIVGGSAQPNSEVTVWADGVPVSCGTGSFQPGADGRWACRLVGLTTGTHQIAASATNALGISSGPSPTQLVLTIDPTAPPTVLLTLVWSLGMPSGQFHPGDTIELTGSGLPVGASAEAEIHSTPQSVGSAITDASGTFTIDAVIPEDIEPGLHTIVVTVTAEGAEPSTLEKPIMIIPRELPPKAAGGVVSDPALTGGAGGDGVLGDRNDPATPAAMTTALDTILQILSNPVFIVTAGAAGLALLLFVAIPAELLNATLSEHYDRIARRIPRTNAGWWARTKALLASTPVFGGIVITLLASIVFGFADPGFGFDLVSLRVVLACAIGLFFVGFVANAATGAIVGRRWGLDTIMELKPLGILLAVIGVVISRLLDFSPGLLIGLLLGISLLGKVTTRDESRTAIVKTGIVWGLSILAWVGYSLLVEPLAGTSFAGNLTVETMVAITTEGLTALLIGLLPFKFLEGSAIWAHNKVLWGAVWLGAAASWVLIVLPQNYGEIRGSIWVWGAVVAGFAIVALAIYFVFRFAVKPEPEDDESENETQKVRIGGGR